jgi:HK97 family phage prohead protease
MTPLPKPDNPPAPLGLCEIRGLELRDADPDPETGAERFEFVGHAAVFDSLSENLGGFRERIMRGAFRNVLDQDVRLLVNHDPNLPLARGTALELTEDPTGLQVRAQIRADLSYARDLRINLEEGNVTQMSFAFGSDVEDEWEEDEGGRLIRTIRKFGSLFDVSPVTFPAYPATDAGVRALSRLSRGEVVSEEEWRAIEALRTDSPKPESTEREDVADAAEPVLEADDSEQRAEVDEANDGAGLSAEAAGRRLAILARRAGS